MLPADKALLERLGARLRELREQAKLSQDAVGERAGFTGKYIGEIEKGTRDVPLSTLRAIAEAGLEVEVESVFAERGSRRVPLDKLALARDVEITASLLVTLPMKVRRPLLALVQALDKGDRSLRAAERSGPRWRGTKRRT